jgi:raffinose/stachyose/melibiose transport system substrate-binding protein
MKKAMRVVAAAAAASLLVAGFSTANAASAAPKCAKKTTVTMLGTIKPEIQDQFLAAVADYNKSQACYTLKSIAGDKSLTFLQNVTPMYAAHNAPTIMYGLQDIPNMASKLMDWKGTKLASLVPSNLLTASTIGGKIVGVPSTVEAFGLLYNKAVLDKAGVNPDKIKTRSDLEAAFKAVEATGTGSVRFSAIWWSLGAHFTNVMLTNMSNTHEGRLKVLDQLADGSIDLTKNAVYQNWLATFNMMNKHNQAKPNLTDTEYTAAVADLAAGKAGFWFMGNWAEPNLLEANPSGKFGIMPVPTGDTASTYGNDSISVGVPGYFMVDKTQSTPAQRAGAVDFLTWLYTSKAGQHHVADNTSAGGMQFIPVYKGFKVAPSTYMSQVISKYVGANKTLEWMNTFYPAGGQEKYGASTQKLITGTIDGNQFASEFEAAWKGSVKTWRGAKVGN